MKSVQSLQSSHPNDVLDKSKCDWELTVALAKEIISNVFRN